MNTKQRNKIIKLIDALDAGLTAHDLLQDIYSEVFMGNIKLSVELETKLDQYFSEDE
jgi:hypothetical protein